MKKLLALVLAGVMAFSLVACGGGETGGEATDGEEKLDVILVCSQLGDKSFNDSADAGLKELAAEGLINYKALEFGNDNSKVNITLEEVAPEYDIVICNNLGYGMATAWLRENAATYADTMFFIYDEPVDMVLDTPNVQMIGYKANESDFLAGALAAMISETGVIGFVGGMESPVIHDFLVGYVEGARYVNPEIEVNVSYIGSYTDAAKGKDLGKTAIDAGADVLHQVAGSAGNGYLEAAMEAGKYGIGVDSDQYEVFKTEKPDLANSIVTSSLKNVGLSLQVLIREVIDGTYEWSQIRWFGIPEGCAGIAENENYLKLVSAEDQAELQAIKEKVANGEITVSTAYGMDAETLKTYH
ncbi:MAG: BMP family ABC transporter substrate-binding protein [Oscillospiraceae bacterium]|nr:BMP family ABC transporter substrate-binding protein [Oscillospiraceae bacterium]